MSALLSLLKETKKMLEIAKRCHFFKANGGNIAVQAKALVSKIGNSQSELLWEKFQYFIIKHLYDTRGASPPSCAMDVPSSQIRSCRSHVHCPYFDSVCHAVMFFGHYACTQYTSHSRKVSWFEPVLLSRAGIRCIVDSNYASENQQNMWSCQACAKRTKDFRLRVLINGSLVSIEKHSKTERDAQQITLSQSGRASLMFLSMDQRGGIEKNHSHTDTLSSAINSIRL